MDRLTAILEQHGINIICRTSNTITVMSLVREAGEDWKYIQETIVATTSKVLEYLGY